MLPRWGPAGMFNISLLVRKLVSEKTWTLLYHTACGRNSVMKNERNKQLNVSNFVGLVKLDIICPKEVSFLIIY